jgi:hypothetical protein
MLLRFLLTPTNQKGDQMEEHKNPIADLVSDDIYELLNSRGLINEKSVRDYIIKKKFKSLRSNKISASDAIDHLRDEYPYLQFDTIRKIVYQPNK